MRSSRVLGAVQYLTYRLLQFISRLLKSLWFFFPSILFILLAIWCFWSLNQGKDLIVAFTENHQAKAFFFIAIAFWIYVSWYSSRITAYIKQSKQEEYILHVSGDTTPATSYFDLPPSWLEKFPRLIGYAGFLAIELAVLQSPALEAGSIKAGKALWFFVLGMIISWGLDNRMKQYAEKNRKQARIIFYCLLGIFLVAATIAVMNKRGTILLLLWVVLLLHIVYLFYINLRHIAVERNAPPKERSSFIFRWIYRVMDFLRVPPSEIGYFSMFNIVCAIGLVIYLLTTFSLRISWQIGPFPFVLLAFAVLGGFGNIISAGSVKARVNLHVILIVLAFLLGSKETHYVRTKQFDTPVSHGIYNERQDIYTFFNNWVSERGPELDTTSTYPVYFVLANGGASRSGYWTASVLGRLEDTTHGKSSQFSRHLFCLSGTSGGGVGVATFFSLLHQRDKLKQEQPVSYLQSGKAFLKRDFLTFTLAHMLGPDYFKYIFHINNRDLPDRAGALEQTLEEGARIDSLALKPAMDEPFSNLLALNNKPYHLPILCINTTRMQDGNPGVVTNISMGRDVFSNRVDVMEALNDTLDMRLSTAAILGARFPYVSPAGRIDEVIPENRRVRKNDSMLIHYFVDGGYFDNSGAGVVQEMIRTILNYTNNSVDTVLKNRVRKLHFTVLHITNSPLGVIALNEVLPLKNDLMSPLLTILGAYDMQTTVNDKRLENFLLDMNRSGICKSAEYYPIHLYKEDKERREGKKRGNIPTEAPYAMNWFISDTTLTRMDNRLRQQPRLNDLIRRLVQ